MSKRSLLISAIVVLAAVVGFLAVGGHKKTSPVASYTQPATTYAAVATGPAKTTPASTTPATKAAAPAATQSSDPGYASSLAAHGFPALADLAVAGDGLKISFLGFNGKKAVVNVSYRGTRNFAHAAFLSFLHRYGDTPQHYRVRWTGPAAAHKQKQLRNMMPLVLKGFNSLIAVPYSKHGLAVRFVRLQGKKAVIDARYAGSRVAARAALKRFFASYSDSPAKYIVHLHTR